MSSFSTGEFRFLEGDAALVGADGPLPAVERVSIPTPSGALSALAWGDDRPGFTLLHGGGLNAHTWDTTLLAVLRPTESALALDLPGHGDSAWRDDADYSPETIATTVIAVLEAHANQLQLLIGQSLGGLAAGVVAARRPDLVRATVVIDAAPFTPIDIPASQPNQVRDFLAGPRVFASRDEIVDRALAFGYGPDRDAVARGVELNTNVRPDGSVVYKHHVGNLDSPAPFAVDFSGLWTHFEAATRPTLLVAATRGFLSPSLVQEFLHRTPGSSLTEVDSGHNVQEEQPVELAQIVRRFSDQTNGD